MNTIDFVELSSFIRQALGTDVERPCRIITFARLRSKPPATSTARRQAKQCRPGFSGHAGGGPRLGYREPEFGAVRRAGRSPEPATVCLDNSSTDRQPHAHAGGLGREQGIKDAMTDRFLDSGPGIPDRDLNASFVVDLRSDPQHPRPVGHGAHGVRRRSWPDS